MVGEATASGWARERPADDRSARAVTHRRWRCPIVARCDTTRSRSSCTPFAAWPQSTSPGPCGPSRRPGIARSSSPACPRSPRPSSSRMLDDDGPAGRRLARGDRAPARRRRSRGRPPGRARLPARDRAVDAGGRPGDRGRRSSLRRRAGRATPGGWRATGSRSATTTTISSSRRSTARPIWDVLLAELPPEVELELDVYWAAVGGRDPVDGDRRHRRPRPAAPHEGSRRRVRRRMTRRSGRGPCRSPRSSRRPGRPGSTGTSSNRTNRPSRSRTSPRRCDTSSRSPSDVCWAAGARLSTQEARHDGGTWIVRGDRRHGGPVRRARGRDQADPRLGRPGVQRRHRRRRLRSIG